MIKKKLNQNDIYVQELIDTVEPKFIFSKEPINRFRVIKNDSNDTRKWEVVFVKSGETMAYNDVSEAINTSSDDCEYCPCDEIVNPAYDPKRNCEAQCIPDPALADKYNYGCTDELAVNYNAEANKDDGSCVHCPCDTDDYFYVINKDRNCNGNPCIKVMKEEDKEEVKEVKEDCDLCDLLDFKIDFVPSMVAPMNLELDMKQNLVVMLGLFIIQQIIQTGMC